MFKRSMFAVAAVTLSSSLFAMGPTSPLDPQYQPPSFKDVYQGEGAMTEDDYMKHAHESWNYTGAKTIDKSNPHYADYKKSSRFTMMDKNHDGSISESEYMDFHKTAWGATKRQSMTQKDYDAWYKDKTNPLNPSFEHVYNADETTKK